MVNLESLELDWFWDASPLVDVFEPTYIYTAFTEKELTLGSLIFGPKEWLKLRATISSSTIPIPFTNDMSSVVEDPLTLMFRKQGVI